MLIINADSSPCRYALSLSRHTHTQTRSKIEHPLSPFQIKRLQERHPENVPQGHEVQQISNNNNNRHQQHHLHPQRHHISAVLSSTSSFHSLTRLSSSKHFTNVRGSFAAAPLINQEQDDVIVGSAPIWNFPTVLCCVSVCFLFRRKLIRRISTVFMFYF